MKNLIQENITSHIEEDLDRLFRQGNIVPTSPLQEVCEAYKKDLACELLDSGYNHDNEEHVLFLKEVIKKQLDYWKQTF